MTDIPIKKCGRLLKFRCPKQWEELTPTKAPTMRFCSTCQKNVYLCKTVEDLERNSGRCVAFIAADIEDEKQQRKRNEKKYRGGKFEYVIGEYDKKRTGVDEK